MQTSTRHESTDFDDLLTEEIATAGGEVAPDPAFADAIGITMFDLPNSEDDAVTVLLPHAHLHAAPAQALLRITSKGADGGQGRQYLGVVTAGPFAEPDSMRGDAPTLVTVAARQHGGVYLPPYHGRVAVTLLGEEQADGTLAPPRFRPLPNSPVFALNDDEAARVLHMEGDLRLGLVVGHANLPLRVPSGDKAVLPRHTAVLGTTGGGKSTTVARLVREAQAADMAVILLDVEGEYTHLHEPTEDERMRSLLATRGLEATSMLPGTMTLYHLIGRDTANPNHPRQRPFTLQFARLSPYAVAEILDLTEAQVDRFHQAYDLAKGLLRALHIFPARGEAAQEKLAQDYDEFERGYPRLTLSLLLDVVGAIIATAGKREPEPYNAALQSDDGLRELKARIGAMGSITSPPSWKALSGKLWRLKRLDVFDADETRAKPLNYNALLTPGCVSVLDLSDTALSELSNLVIADLLRGVQEAQDGLYAAYERARRESAGAPQPPRVLIVIEEAHEFLSKERIEKMPVLFGQVGRLAKRGRKRWLGLVFVTQFPQHLPRQVLGLVNSFVLHKISDPHVVSELQRTVSGVDDALWRRLPGLAPGQAVVSFPHMTRPLLISVDPTPAQLRLVD